MVVLLGIGKSIEVGVDNDNVVLARLFVCLFITNLVVSDEILGVQLGSGHFEVPKHCRTNAS